MTIPNFTETMLNYRMW